MSDLVDLVTVKVTHIGGPWDGQEEEREIGKAQVEFIIYQELVPIPEGGKKYLHHHYRIQIRETVRLIYRGYTPADTVSA